MTYQEANALVDDFSFIYKGKSIPKEALIECREVIHKALEKQIPKKLNKILNKVVCPTCKTFAELSPYCRYCGQALDWSEGEK